MKKFYLPVLLLTALTVTTQEANAMATAARRALTGTSIPAVRQAFARPSAVVATARQYSDKRKPSATQISKLNLLMDIIETADITRDGKKTFDIKKIDTYVNQSVGSSTSSETFPITIKCVDIILIVAISYGEVDLIKRAIEAGADVNNAVDIFGNTPLGLATRLAPHDAITIITLLVKAGARVNDQTNSSGALVPGTCRATVLHEAIFYNNKEAVKLLIKSGANYEEVFAKAVSERNFDLIELIVKAAQEYQDSIKKS